MGNWIDDGVFCFNSYRRVADGAVGSARGEGRQGSPKRARERRPARRSFTTPGLRPRQPPANRASRARHGRGLRRRCVSFYHFQTGN